MTDYVDEAMEMLGTGYDTNLLTVVLLGSILNLVEGAGRFYLPAKCRYLRNVRAPRQGKANRR